jgi:hypothetical protein
LGAIEPTPEAVTIAKTSHESLRELLRKDDDVSPADPDSYLAGSYARDTAIKDIKDVDIILLINLDHTKTSPDVVVAWLQSVLQKEEYEELYPTVRAQGRSVRATTASSFELDVVPSVAISHRDGPVWIPDRDAQEWVASHPRGQIAFGVQRNASTDGRYKHLVKIMKHWRDRLTPAAARVKSYILESLVAENITIKPQSYGHGVVRVLQGIDTAYASYVRARIVPSIPDPGYPGVNVAKRWKFAEFAAFMESVVVSRKAAEAALSEPDKERSIALWRRLFGTAFEPRSQS